MCLKLVYCYLSYKVHKQTPTYLSTQKKTNNSYANPLIRSYTIRYARKNLPILYICSSTWHIARSLNIISSWLSIVVKLNTLVNICHKNTIHNEIKERPQRLPTTKATGKKWFIPRSRFKQRPSFCVSTRIQGPRRGIFHSCETHITDPPPVPPNENDMICAEMWKKMSRTRPYCIWDEWLISTKLGK